MDTVRAQISYSPVNVWSHNDYDQSIPLYNAFNQEVGFIEADVYLLQGQLLVSHELKDVNPRRTLSSMYLKPLDSLLKRNDKYVDYTLTLSVDLKTEGRVAIPVLISILNEFPDLIHHPHFKIMVSGEMPKPETWSSIPDYIYFDGRPSIMYTPEQWKRVNLVSTSFLGLSDERKMDSLIATIHQIQKPIRFWAIPDNPKGWQHMMDHQVDILNTDHVDDVIKMIKTK